MNILVGRILNLAALAAFASTGLMQGAQQATFHLPVTAHWGRAVLEPGDYKMSLPAPYPGENQFLVRGARHSAFELPMLTDIKKPSRSSSLQLVKINGNYFVRQVSIGSTGKTFTFSVPKTSHRQEVETSENRTLAIAGN
jgi:hypothetical protein